MPTGEKMPGLTSPCSSPDSSSEVYPQRETVPTALPVKPPLQPRPAGEERGEPPASHGRARSITEHRSTVPRSRGGTLPSCPGWSQGTRRISQVHFRAQKKIHLDFVGKATLLGKEQQRQYRISKCVVDQRQEIKWPLRCLPQQSRCFIKPIWCGWERSLLFQA